MIRRKTKLLVSLGDCAVTGNVPAMRNSFSVDAVLQRGYVENATHNPGVPGKVVPVLEPKVVPLHEVVPGGFVSFPAVLGGRLDPFCFD